MKSQKEGIIAASVMALLILGAASSFSLMPVTHAQSVSSVTWNFREADSLPNTTVTLTYGFEQKNGSIETTYWYNGAQYYYYLATFQVVESQTVNESSGNFTFEANMSANCTSSTITGFISETYTPAINGMSGTSVSITQVCTNGFLWAGTSLA